MNRLLHENKDFKYYVTDIFNSKMLIPIVKNIRCNKENEWYDYNEMQRCHTLINSIHETGLKLDFHSICKGEDMVGIGIIAHGTENVTFAFPKTFHPAEEADSIVICSQLHFPVEKLDMGNYWLENIILPYYSEKGFEALYVKSSYFKAISLQRGLGKRMEQYHNDTGLKPQAERIYRIQL